MAFDLLAQVLWFLEYAMYAHTLLTQSEFTLILNLIDLRFNVYHTAKVIWKRNLSL